MVIISKAAINQFTEKHANSKDALEEWYHTVKQANWHNFNEVRQSFNSADYVGQDRYVFNIKGNHYRLVAMIFFNVRTVYIKFIGTHSDYDKIDVLTIDIK